MGTITRSHTFTAGEKPTDTQWNVDINQLFTLVNGNIDNANIDLTSTYAWTAAHTWTSSLTVGVDGTGHDVKFFGDTSGQYMMWDQSADELVLAGDTKLSFHDAAGGENIIATSDGHLEVNAGTTLDITAPTVDLNSSTEFNIDTAAYDLNASGAVTIDGAGVSIDSSSASNLTTSSGALTITSAAAATWSTAAGALTLGSGAAINITPAAGSAIVLDGTINVDAGVVTGATSITLSGELDAGSLDVSGNADIDGTLEADAYTVDGTALNEYIADTIGAMVTGTETGISVSYDDSDNTLDFVVGTLNQDTTGTAAIATTVTITDNESTNEDNAIVFTAGGDVDGGNLGLESDGTLTYNPSTGSVTATGFIGALTGNASTATALAAARTIGGVSFDGTGNINLPGVNTAGNQNTSGTAAVATAVTITDNESTNETNAIVFTSGGDVDGGNLGLESDGDLTYNPSSGLLSATAVTATGAVNTGALTSTGNISFDGGSFVFNESGADKDFRIEGDTNANLFVADASEDKIGFGTATPGPGLVTLGGGVAATTVRIDIDGGSDNGKGAQLAFRSGSTDKFYIGDAASLQGGSESSRDMTLYTTSGCGIRFYTGGNNRRMDITSDGDVQMAAGSDITQAAGNDMNFKVSVNRDIIFSDTAEIGRFTGAGSTLQLQGLTASQDVQTDGSKNLTSVSDQNWKNDLGLIDNATAIINKLQPRYFTWKKDSQGDFTDPDQPRLAGFFAQEVYVAFPEGSPGGANTDADGVDHWGLNGRALLALAVRGFQELDKRVSALE